MDERDSAGIALQRSNIYGLLAAVYRQEATSDLLEQVKDPEFLGVLGDLGVGLGDGFADVPDGELLDALAVEYALLFLGPGRHISPHESVHRNSDDGGSGMLWGESTVAVKKFIEFSGLEYRPDYAGIPDHISVELDLMQKMAHREGKAWEEGDRDGALRCLKYERQFMHEHLICWVPAFCEKVIASAESPFYRAMASITKLFIELEYHEMNRNDTTT